MKNLKSFEEFINEAIVGHYGSSYEELPTGIKTTVDKYFTWYFNDKNWKNNISADDIIDNKNTDNFIYVNSVGVRKREANNALKTFKANLNTEIEVKVQENKGGSFYQNTFGLKKQEYQNIFKLDGKNYTMFAYGEFGVHSKNDI